MYSPKAHYLGATKSSPIDFFCTVRDNGRPWELWCHLPQMLDASRCFFPSTHVGHEVTFKNRFTWTLEFESHLAHFFRLFSRSFLRSFLRSFSVLLFFFVVFPCFFSFVAFFALFLRFFVVLMFFSPFFFSLFFFADFFASPGVEP